MSIEESMTADFMTTLFILGSLAIAFVAVAIKSIWDHNLKIAYIAFSAVFVFGYLLVQVLAMYDALTQPELTQSWSRMPSLTSGLMLVAGLVLASLAFAVHLGEVMHRRSLDRREAKLERMRSAS